MQTSNNPTPSLSTSHIHSEHILFGEMSRIADNIWLSSLAGAIYTLNKNPHAFTHILSCMEHDPKLKTHAKQLLVPIPDNTHNVLIPHLNTAIAFINDAHQQQGTMLIHCEMGSSRSAALITAWLMQNQKLTLEQALKKIHQIKPDILLSPQLRQELQIWQTQPLTISHQGPK